MRCETRARRSPRACRRGSATATATIQPTGPSERPNKVRGKPAARDQSVQQAEGPIQGADATRQ
eukprot:897969-Alexandrium_andersonii.AAC.1